jgi:hypothetical protein
MNRARRPIDTRVERAARLCPLLGVKRTSRFAPHMSAFDPKRTWAELRLSHFRCLIAWRARRLRKEAQRYVKAGNRDIHFGHC